MSIAQALPGRRHRLNPSGSTVGASARHVHLARSHPAIREGRTLFPNRITTPGDGQRGAERVLKSGNNSRKIGGRVAKGKWRGFPVFTLTLHERATCPTTCKQWLTCYGNTGQWAVRFSAGPILESALDRELTALAQKHPRGFVVRLHVLGDFYSVPYVERWMTWLDRFPNLRIFGYTAWQPETPIGRAVAFVRDSFWERFAVRTSDGPGDASTETIDYPGRGRLASGAIVCPAQSGDTDCCSSCGICWATRDRIAFRQH